LDDLTINGKVSKEGERRLNMKYFYRLHDGSRYEVDKLDYNNICGRISNGRYNGYYLHRGKINPNMKFAFKYFMNIETEGIERKDEIVRNIDVDKRKPPEVGKPKKIVKGCQHDWNDDQETWQYIQTNIDGRIQYRKECLSCKKVSMLVKPKEVESVMQSVGKTISDVTDRTK